MNPFKLLSFVFILFAMVFSYSSSAQSRILTNKPTKATLTNADTAYINYIGIGAQEASTIHYVHDKVSGTVAGKAYLEISNNNSDWVIKDSLSLTDVAKSQKIFETSPFHYRSARIKIYTTNGVSKPSAVAYFIKPK